MISHNEVFAIGYFTKTHGVKGEISLHLSTDIFQEDSYPYLVVEVDGILVPFFILSFRYKGASSALLLFEGVDTAEKAKRLVGASVFVHGELYQPQEDISEGSWQIFRGFSVCDAYYGDLGKVIDVDDNTPNILFLLELPSGETHPFPAAEPLIREVDMDKKILYTTYPKGLLE